MTAGWAGLRRRGAGSVRHLAWLLLATVVVGGCASEPRILNIYERGPIDRSLVEYPAGFELRRYVAGLTAPTAIAFDAQGNLLVAMGQRDEEPTIIGFRSNGSSFRIYPQGRRLPFGLPTPGVGWRMYGPIGGMLCYHGKVYVSHRDAAGMGAITALDYEGHHTTIIAGMPSRGETGVTDLAISPTGRLYFGIGTATNSGVVGLDNWEEHWVRRYPLVHDEPWQDLALLGYRFDTPNPLAGLFGPAELAVTAPFQPFNHSNQTRIKGVAGPNGDNKPNGAICWVSPEGGFPVVEAHGVHYPSGIVFNEFGRMYFTNRGMEMRGTRPIKDDPDALLRLVPGGTWYGWPDYTTDFDSVSDARHQPPVEMVSSTGYPEVRPTIDQDASHLIPPSRDTLLQAEFPSLSGASRIDVVPPQGPFKEFRGNVLVALRGDRAPFATSGRKLAEIVGYKVVRVDVDTRAVRDFVRNTAGKPRSWIPGESPSLLERPDDVKFGPDGVIYILDFGQMEMRGGTEHVTPGSGQIFLLQPIAPAPPG